MSDAEGITVYEAAGGMPFFERLVCAFYEGVRYDPVLRPMYPDDDMEGAQRRLALLPVSPALSWDTLMREARYVQALDLLP